MSISKEKLMSSMEHCYGNCFGNKLWMMMSISDPQWFQCESRYGFGSSFYLNADPDPDPGSQTQADPDPEHSQTLPSQEV